MRLGSSLDVMLREVYMCGWRLDGCVSRRWMDCGARVRGLTKARASAGGACASVSSSEFSPLCSLETSPLYIGGRLVRMKENMRREKEANQISCPYTLLPAAGHFKFSFLPCRAVQGHPDLPITCIESLAAKKLIPTQASYEIKGSFCTRCQYITRIHRVFEYARGRASRRY